MKKWIKYILIGGVLGAIWGIVAYIAPYLPLPKVLIFFLYIPLLVSVVVLKLFIKSDSLVLLFFSIPTGILLGSVLSILFCLVRGKGKNEM